MIPSRKLSKFRVAVAISIALVMMAFLASSAFVLKSYIRRWISGDPSIHQQLNIELDNIPTPAQAVRVHHVDNFKGTQGNIVNSYKTSLRYDDIRVYYDRELQGRGWKLYGESKVTSWGNDLGESQRIYCKPPLALDIYFPGQNETGIGYTYSLSVSWRLVDECPS